MTTRWKVTLIGPHNEMRNAVVETEEDSYFTARKLVEAMYTGYRVGKMSGTRLDRPATTWSSAGTRSSGNEGAALLVLILAAPFFPIVYLGYRAYDYLANIQHIHSLFSMLIAAAPIVGLFYLLYRSREFRYLYFGGELLWLCYLTFNYIDDKIWASFWTGLLLILGGLLVHTIANEGFGKVPSKPMEVDEDVEA